MSERHEYFKDKQRLQDSYSFRCVSQIKGIIWEMLDFFKNIVDNEINNVSTVPLVLNEEKDKEVIFGGNFCDFSLVQAVDMLNMGLNEIGSISDVK